MPGVWSFLRVTHVCTACKEHTVCSVGACQDGAAGDIVAHANKAVIALALGDGSLVAIAVHTCQCDRQVCKQDLHTS